MGKIEFIDEIVQKNNGVFPLLDSNNLRGGLYTVETISERDAIPIGRCKVGMLCFVKNENKYYKVVSIINDITTWEEAKFGGGGIPLYFQNLIDDLINKGEILNEYISVPNPGDLNKTLNGDSYLDIIFKSIRALQAEVSRLKNSFNYGIVSYNDGATAMSDIVNDKINEEEPLWAIDPEDLAEIPDASVVLEDKCDLIGNSIEQFENHVKINDIAYKEVHDFLNLDNCPENKICVYIQGFLNNDSIINLELLNENRDIKTIQVSNHITKGSFRNILLILNRLVLDEETEKYNGINYLYSLITDSKKNILSTGYLDIDSTFTENINQLDDIYFISKIIFNNIDLYKCNFYVKDSSFTNEGNGLSVLPDSSNFKFGAAHITIRSVKTKDVLTQVSDHLLNNELIFVESENLLYIKNKNNIISLSSGTSEGGQTMTESQILEILKQAGIITENNELNSIALNDIEKLTFTHSDSGQKFNISVNADGDLLVDNVTNPLLPDTFSNEKYTVRGTVGKYSLGSYFEHLVADQALYGYNNDPLAYGDRVRFGSWYVPVKDQSVFSCSHDFIELANSGTFDYSLENARLYIVKGDIEKIGSSQYLKNAKLYKFILKGTIKAGSTYLIRGKKHAVTNEVITVDSYDYELRSHQIQETPSESAETNFENVNTKELFSLEGTVAMILLNGNDNDKFKLLSNVLFDGLQNHIISTFSVELYKNKYTSEEKKSMDFVPFDVEVFSELIDSILLDNASAFISGNQKNVLGTKNYSRKADTIYKDSFELDPSRQGFLSLSTTSLESTNYRLNKINSEEVPLKDKNISFFHTEELFPVSNYTPKASKLNKNICTDKSKLNINKPNMVSCYFGIDMQTTRCFNWVSVPERNEYVWIREKGTTSWDNRFESYKGHSSEITSNDANNVYETGNMNRVKYSKTVIDAVYKRITGVFPGSNYTYCAHKCVVYINDAQTDSPKTYEYIVGPTLSNGQPNLEFTSNIQSFTLYPILYQPLVYQISDQQGFNWIEYQVWAAAAKQILKLINEECNDVTRKFPVLINTGDCTQNGTRYNEWLDYYNAGYCLFDHLEQFNVVGNNDLANAYDYSKLGTGNDEGKSNPYYFNLINCYLLDDTANYTSGATEYDNFWQHPLIVNNIYFPSTYYSYFNNFGYLFVNSELTVSTCKGLFKTTNGDLGKTYNLYTGYLESSNSYDKSKLYSTRNFASTISSMIDRLTTKTGTKNIIAACHEMPFTVITEAYLKNTANTVGIIIRNGYTDRSCTSGYAKLTHTSLIGSHLNRIHYGENWENDYNYWFSELLQNKNIPLCIGGHKHSYTATYPIIEMNESLWDIIVNTIKDEALKASILSYLGNQGKLRYSKLFLIINDNIDPLKGIINLSVDNNYYPTLGCHSEVLNDIVLGTSFSNIKPVVYFMCQATGYKLKSNKELPSVNQTFSIIKPKSSEGAAHFSLESPMFATIKLNNNEFQVSLYRIVNIKITNMSKITEFSYPKHSKKPMITEKLILIKEGNLISNYWLTDSSLENNYEFNFISNDILEDFDRCWIGSNGLQSRTKAIVNTETNVIETPSVDKLLTPLYQDYSCTLKVKI